MAVLGNVLTGSPIEWSHPLNRDLVGWWMPLPHWSGGGKLFDLCRRNDGALTNMDPATAWRSGTYGTGIYLAGASQYINCGVLSGVVLSGGYAVTCVFRTTYTDATYPQIATIDSSSVNRAWQYRVTPTGKLEFLRNAAISSVSATSVTDGEWHVGEFSWDGPVSGLSSLYLDGLPESVTTSTTAQNSVGTEPLLLGARRSSSPTSFFIGDLAGVIIRVGTGLRPLYTEVRAGHPDTLRRPRGRSMVSVPAGGGATPWLYARRQTQIIGGGMGL